MSANSKKSMNWTIVLMTIVLIFFGLVALFGGEKWLVLLIPAAVFVWHTARPMLRTGRN
jgi:uncharacterized membrane protein